MQTKCKQITFFYPNEGPPPSHWAHGVHPLVDTGGSRCPPIGGHWGLTGSHWWTLGAHRLPLVDTGGSLVIPSVRLRGRIMFSHPHRRYNFINTNQDKYQY